jgi:hypothetical protein
MLRYVRDEKEKTNNKQKTIFKKGMSKENPNHFNI